MSEKIYDDAWPISYFMAVNDIIYDITVKPNGEKIECWKDALAEAKHIATSNNVKEFRLCSDWGDVYWGIYRRIGESYVEAGVSEYPLLIPMDMHGYPGVME